MGRGEPGGAHDGARRPDVARAGAAAGLVRTVYLDDTGRQWAVLVPPGREDDAALGVVIGPPDVRDVLPDLPEGLAVRLHNELFVRGLLTERDLRGRAAELGAALQSSLRVDVVALLNAYRAG